MAKTPIEYEGTTQTIEKGPSTAVKVSVLIILILLLGAGILLPIKLVPNALTSIGSAFSSFVARFNKQEIVLTTNPQEIKAGEPFTLSWTGTHKNDGSYVLTYICREGVRLETSINQPHETIPCNTPFYFTPLDNALNITSFSSSTKTSDIKIALSFLPNNSSDQEALNELALSIRSGSTIIGTVATTTPSTPSVPNPPRPPVKNPPVLYPPSNPNGTADLKVNFIRVGYKINGQVGIQFEIMNIGTKDSGPWSFGASLPSLNTPSYTSPVQQNIHPGDRMLFTLAFDNVPAGQNQMTINVDPTNLIPELSESNNILTQTISNL